jgi:hypothetical protein
VVVCSPDGQSLAVIARTTVHSGEFGLPEENLPEKVLELEPVQGAEGVAMLSVLGQSIGVQPAPRTLLLFVGVVLHVSLGAGEKGYRSGAKH